MIERLKERGTRFLRWSERYTKTDMVYLASGGFWSVSGQVVAAFISLGLAVVMARYVPKDTYGNYKFILAVISIIATLSLSGIGSAVFQSIAHGYRGSLVEGFWANLRWSALVFLGAFAVGAYYLLQGNTTLALGVLLGGCMTPFLTGFNLYNAIFSGEKDFKGLAWYGDFVTNIIPAALLMLVAYFAPQPLYLLLAYFIGNTAASAYAFWRGMQRYPDLEKKRDPGLLTYGKHLSAMNILSGIAGNIDQILLFHFVGPVQVAIYNFATAIPDQAKGPMKSLDTMMQARFVKRSEDDFASSLWNKMLWLFLTTAAGIAVYWLLAPFIFKLFFPAYADAVSYSQVYALSLFTVVTYPIASYFAARKYVRVQYIGTIATNIIQIALMVIGTLVWGLWGLIIARVVTRVFTNVVSYLLYSFMS